ncbi:MAG: Wadjet anti-phage system protein JetD domain-containing protein, partial [Cyanobacteria bacterium J06555_13]
GFKILAQLRSHFPQTQSLLMDQSTYDAFQGFAITVKPQSNEPLAHLTATEQTLYHYLAEQGLRLEQERISQSRVNICLKQLLR